MLIRDNLVAFLFRIVLDLHLKLLRKISDKLEIAP